jgi:hypothetical protein
MIAGVAQSVAYSVGGVLFSLLAIRPNVRGFKPGRGDLFLRAIQIRSTPSFGAEVNPEAPCRKILQRVKSHLQA